MGKSYRAFLVVVVCAMSGVALGQGGQGGFGGGQGRQGTALQRYNSEVQRIDRAVNNYFDAEGVKSILTPGQFNQWSLKLKKGQVVIADVTSEVFDPALQIIQLEDDEDEEAPGTALKENDDRFIGDQRPLLIWRCEEDGDYKLRVRCFRDKSGGQFAMRMKVFDSFDVSPEGPSEFELDGQQRVLLRLQLKAGEIQRIVFEMPNNKDYVYASLRQAISPLGLPDVNLTSPLDSIIFGAVMASVDGDYYVITDTSGEKDKKLRASVQTIEVKEMQESDGVLSAKAKTDRVSLWKFSFKKGEVIRVLMNGLDYDVTVVHAEAPDISNLSIAEKLEEEQRNPFFPRVPKEDEELKQKSYMIMPARARDSRVQVFVALRDTTLWFGTNGAGPDEEEYTVTVRPAPEKFVVGKRNSGELSIGYTDYWEFEAKAGDVMTFDTEMVGYAGQIVILDPDLQPVYQRDMTPDETKLDWNLIVTKPGRYLAMVSAIGAGGSGTYSLEREEFSAKPFSRKTSAKGDLTSAEAEVWTFTAVPETPLYLHWKVSNRDYTAYVIDKEGNRTSMGLTRIDDQNDFGIIKVRTTKTFVIVLISKGKKVDYEIKLSSLPGYKDGN